MPNIPMHYSMIHIDQNGRPLFAYQAQRNLSQVLRYGTLDSTNIQQTILRITILL